MIAGRFYCSESARLRHEHLFGTAPQVDNWFLLEHPRPWSEKGFPDERLSVPLRDHLKSYTQKIRRSRPLMIRQCNSSRSTLEFFALRCRERDQNGVRISLPRHDDLLHWEASAISDHSVAEGQGAARWNKPLYLVCTHGKHDQCCAKFGYATYCAMREVSGVAAWECSHVGGDRFAANVLCFPEGIYYGHVQPEDAASLVATHQAGQISLKHYRGRSCYSRAAQAGEYFARRESGLLSMQDLMLLNSSAGEPDQWQVRFVSAGGARVHELDLQLRDAPELARTTCKSETANTIRAFELRGYREVAAEEAL